MVKSWCLVTGLIVSAIATTGDAKGPAASGKSTASPTTVEALRTRGQAGLTEALAAYDSLQRERSVLDARLAKLHENYEANKQAALELERRIAAVQSRLDRMAAAIDQIGGQRSCSVSRLYWYTDLNEAKTAAFKTGRPILSLRMLGKLTDEFSCANSRFFRTALYSNKDISTYLRDNFVLHWQSVRPVPRVTIDFGDGRKLERTLTGNSAHYVLTAEGQPLDVLPGLYGPKQFRDWLERTHDFHTSFVSSSMESRPGILQSYHAQRRDAVMRQWDADLERLEPEMAATVMARLTSLVRTAQPAARADSGHPPKAALADAQSAPKRATAIGIMRFANLGGERLERAMDDDAWQAIAGLHRGHVKLDEASVAVMGREFPQAELAGSVAISKTISESPLLRMVRTFEISMALDTVRNEYLLHRKLHQQFAEDASFTADLDALNEWVYAELFLTPSSDPWLGLAPRDVYTALENDGRTVPVSSVARQPNPSF